ncbi:MAG: hypothetical protein M3N08_05765 [Pseudomonadota bacterium]|nr:hypothetical protein [Pseudomonadota bacterium]
MVKLAEGTDAEVIAADAAGPGLGLALGVTPGVTLGVAPGTGVFGFVAGEEATAGPPAGTTVTGTAVTGTVVTGTVVTPCDDVAGEEAVGDADGVGGVIAGGVIVAGTAGVAGGGDDSFGWPAELGTGKASGGTVIGGSVSAAALFMLDGVCAGESDRGRKLASRPAVLAPSAWAKAFGAEPSARQAHRTANLMRDTVIGNYFLHDLGGWHHRRRRQSYSRSSHNDKANAEKKQYEPAVHRFLPPVLA